MASNGQISLETLNMEQLNSLKGQLENELKQYANSYTGLREAQARFKESKKALSVLTPTATGKAVYMPLTPSMYVPGKLQDVSNVLVDVGTGYYVEKPVKDAEAFMDRKITFLQSNTESLIDLIDGKRGDLESVITFMQNKLQSSTDKAKK